MSILSSQCDGLREAANMLDEIGISIGHDTTASAFIAHDISERMREAADTITSLWNSLTASEAALNKAAGNWAKADSQIRENGGRESNYEKLFGTPERAARTMALMCECSPECSFCLLQGRAVSICNNGDRDALFEWLMGDA